MTRSMSARPALGHRRLCAGLALALAPLFAHGQGCRTFHVDGNLPTNNFRKAIEDVNALGCTSGGFNRIIIDNLPGGFGDTVLPWPLPPIDRPTEITLFSPGSGQRHAIRSMDAMETATGYGLRIRARVIVNDIDIVGGSGRAFLGGILLEQGAHDSQVRGVRIENVRAQGIVVAGVNGVEIRRSNHNATEIYHSGSGVSAAMPLWEPAILVNGAVNTTIYGTYLGQRMNGDFAGNCTYGIEVLGSTGVFIGSTLANNNLRNHIGGNNYGGIRVRDSSLVNIRGNYVGLASNGQTLLGNGHGVCFGSSAPNLPRGGVVIENSQIVAFGGGEGEGNVVVGNNRGVIVDGSQDVTLRRSLIGQRPSGQGGVNLGDAIRVQNGAGTTGTVLIGGTAAQANVIRGGTGSGWGVNLMSGIGRVDLRRNAIWAHTVGGIDRTGAPNPPVLTVADAGSGFVAGTLAAVPDAGEIDFHADEGGQGRWFLGTVPVAASATGFSLTLAGPDFVEGRNLTATFTRLAGSPAGTSRFSTPIPIVGNDVIFRHGFETP